MGKGKFHVVIVNKFLDSFHERVVATNVGEAEVLAKEAFVTKCKSSKGKDDKKTLAHFKMFANPVDAGAYQAKIKAIQDGVAEHKKEKKEGSPEEWAVTQIAGIK